MAKKADPIADEFVSVKFEDGKAKVDQKQLEKAAQEEGFSNADEALMSAFKDPQVAKSFDMAARLAAADVASLVISKQRDYGPGNILNSVVKPEIAIAVRLTDKIARLVNLAEKGVDPENEALTDTAMDVMGYGLVLYMVLSGTFTLPLED